MTPNPVVCGSSLIAAAGMLRLRRGLGWSQKHLAAEAGLSGPMITLLECGQRNFTLPVLEKIAGALGTSVPAMLTPAAPQDGGAAG